MQEKKQNESGSMMMEIIAVLAILAIMTPIVYQQALKRSREISNVNMADEMRTVKNAVKAYLDANKTICSSVITDDSIVSCTDNVNIADIYKFLPDGSTICINDVSEGEEECKNNYLMEVYAYNQTYTNNDETITEPKLYAVLSSESQPANLKKGRAMKIASLVGAAGGICDKSSADIVGSYGSWGLAHIDDVCQFGNDVDWTVVVRTDM